MKRNYLKPSIKIKKVETDCTMAALSVGGNTGIGIGEGTPPGTASSKQNTLDGGSQWPKTYNAWED